VCRGCSVVLVLHGSATGTGGQATSKARYASHAAFKLPFSLPLLPLHKHGNAAQLLRCKMTRANRVKPGCAICSTGEAGGQVMFDIQLPSVCLQREPATPLAGRPPCYSSGSCQSWPTQILPIHSYPRLLSLSAFCFAPARASQRMLLILAGALCLTAAGAAGVVRYVMFGHEEERSRKPAVLADPECRRAVRELLADVEVNLRRLRRTQPGPQRRCAAPLWARQYKAVRAASQYACLTNDGPLASDPSTGSADLASHLPGTECLWLAPGPSHTLSPWDARAASACARCARRCPASTSSAAARC